MKKANQHQIFALEILNKLKHEREHAQLNPTWTQMDPSEREELAEVLFHEGKELILQGEHYAFHIFDVSRRIAPLSAKLQFEQAHFLFNYAVHKCSEKYLLLAEKHIQHALEIKNNYFDAWYVWGDILAHLGLVYKEAHYFQKADEKYARAYQLSLKKPNLLKKFLWDWALCWYFLGRHSGEAADIKRALEKFEQTAELGCNEPAFWLDYGNAWSEIGLLICDNRFLEKAITYYQKAIQLNPKYFVGWLDLANTYQAIYVKTKNEEVLAQAHSAYTKAAELRQDHFDLWLSWGNLFLHSGRSKEEPKHLQMCIMKFSKALKILPNHPETLSRWGEALIALGSLTSRLDHLKLAEQKIIQALDAERENPTFWYRYGFCLYAQGQYFEDSDYYMMAIEKFNHALTIEPSHFKSLNGMGLAHFALGDEHADVGLLKKSSYYFQKSSEIYRDNSDLWNHWGMALTRLADLLDSQEMIEEAIEKYNRAIELYADSTPSVQLLYNYACALDFLGGFNENLDPTLYEKAAQILELVLEEDPSYSPAYYNLALVYAHLGEILDDVDFYNKAIEKFHQAIQEDPEDELVWNAWGMTLTHYARLIYEPLKVDLYESLIEEAEKKLKQAIALGNLDAFYNLSCLYCLSGDLSLALHYLQQAHQKEALPSIEQIMYDDYLEPLRQSEDFQDFVQTHLLKKRTQDL